MAGVPASDEEACARGVLHRVAESVLTGRNWRLAKFRSGEAGLPQASLMEEKYCVSPTPSGTAVICLSHQFGPCRTSR
jgi:hypothetical protein